MEYFRKPNGKQIVEILLLALIAIVSYQIVSKIAVANPIMASVMESLNEKKDTVMKLTAAASGAAFVLSLLPGDASSPIANAIMNLTGYFLIIIAAILLEKFLAEATGIAAFVVLIPAACILRIFYVLFPKDALRRLSIKIALFAIAIFLLVPVSVKVADRLDDVYRNSVNQALELAPEEVGDTTVSDSVTEEETEKESESWIEKATDAVKGIASQAGNTVKNGIDNGKKQLDSFLEAIAVLLLMTCGVPILILIFFSWLLKLFFGITLPRPDRTLKNPKFLPKGCEKEEILEKPENI